MASTILCCNTPLDTILGISSSNFSKLNIYELPMDSDGAKEEKTDQKINELLEAVEEAI